MGSMDDTTGTTGRTGPLERARRAVVAAAVLALVIGASVVGLHDWADAHATGSSQHTEAA